MPPALTRLPNWSLPIPEVEGAVDEQEGVPSSTSGGSTAVASNQAQFPGSQPAFSCDFMSYLCGSLKIHLLQEVLCAVKVLNGQVIVAEGEALLVGDLPHAGVGPLPALQLPLLSLLQAIDLQVIRGSKSKLLSYIVVPGTK